MAHEFGMGVQLRLGAAAADVPTGSVSNQKIDYRSFLTEVRH